MKVIVSLSGGMDSATVLATAIDHGHECQAVMFYYGSKHNVYEERAADNIAAHYKVPLTQIDLTVAFSEFKSKLLKGGGVIPEGHYEEESMRATVVPMRNMIFGSILGGIAVSRGASQIWMGMHAGDHAIYPDCRPGFLQTFSHALYLADDRPIQIIVPFVYETKSQILKKGLKLNVPYQLTRTCYKDQPVACGKCGACQERLEAFKFNDTEDPIEYESREIMTKKG